MEESLSSHLLHCVVDVVTQYTSDEDAITWACEPYIGSVLSRVVFDFARDVTPDDLCALFARSRHYKCGEVYTFSERHNAYVRLETLHTFSEYYDLFIRPIRRNIDYSIFFAPRKVGRLAERKWLIPYEPCKKTN